MSARASSRSKAKSKESAPAAAAAATAPAPAAAAAKRSTRRKRGEETDEEQAAAKSTADDSSAPAQPESKKARKGAAAAPASPATKPPTRRGGRSASPAPAAAAAASAAASDDAGMADEETKDDAAEADEDGDDADEDDPNHRLNIIRSATVGHMFLTRGDSANNRPSCPLIISHCILDFLTVREIVTTQAAVAKSWYASAVEYGARVQQTMIKQAHAAVAVTRSASSSSSSAAAAAAASAVTVTVGSRSDVATFSSVKAVTSMISSRLRGCVSSILVRPTAKYNTATGKLGLNTALITRLGTALPHLRSLECGVCAPTSTPDFSFPPNLRTLLIECQYKHGIHVSKAKREARSRPVPAGWTKQKCAEFTVRVIAEVAKCAALQHLGFGVSSIYMTQLDGSWFAPLASLGQLQSITILGQLKDGHQSFTRNSVPALRKCKALRSLSSGSAESATVLRSLLAPPNDFTAFESFSFGEGLTIDDDHLPGLLSVKHSLTTLTPTDWNVKSIDWITQFPRLTTVRFSDPTPARGSAPRGYHYGMPAVPPVPLAPALTVDTVTQVLTQMPQITSLTLHFAALSNAQLWSIVGCMRLRDFSVASKAVTTLECFSQHKHLSTSLQTLKINLPSVPRDEVSHLLSLSELTSLNIAGSFSDPLYAKQLFPFLPPYPKAQLHWLRSFTPRSAKEPVPTPPVDLAARAAAYADFDARVRAGEVRAAELLNNAQLSGVLQFLDIKAFSFAGRTGRAWRAAASLPSAWGMKRSATDAQIVYDRTPDVGAQLYLVGSSAWARSPDTVFAASGRPLWIASYAPECTSTVLPQLPLYRNARGVRLRVETNEKHPNWGGTRQPNDQDRTAIVRALAAIALLPRLEAISFDLVQFTPNHSLPFFSAVGPQLKRAVIGGMPLEAYQYLTLIEELDLSWSERSFAVIACPGKELGVCSRLRKLSLSGKFWNQQLGSAVRALSADHSLRELNLSLIATVENYYYHQANAATSDFSRNFLHSFLQTIAGKEQAATAATAAAAFAAAIAAPAGAGAAETVLGLDDDEPAAASAPTAPALLEIVRLHVDFDQSHVHLPFPADDLFALPKLKTLAIYTGQRIPLSLKVIESLHAQGTLPPLESLSLRVGLGDDASSWHALSLLSGLKELRIVEPPTQTHLYGIYVGYGRVVNSTRLPPAALTRLTTTLPLIETLALESVIIPPSEMQAMRNWTQLRCLSLAGQTGLTVGDFAFLPQLPHLRELSLNSIGLPLIDNWMATMGKPDADADADAEGAAEAEAEEETKAEAAAAEVKPMDVETDGAAAAAPDAPAAAAASSSSSSDSAACDAPADCLLTYLSQCASLQLLRWKSSATTLAANEGYTADRSWFKSRGKISLAMQRRRSENELARERQALRTLLAARVESRGQSRSPILRIESFSPSTIAHNKPDTRHKLQLAPPQTEETAAAEMADDAAAAAASPAAAASSSSASAAAATAAASPALALAIRDAFVMSTEIEEEAEWKQTALELAAAKLKKGRRVL